SKQLVCDEPSFPSGRKRAAQTHDVECEPHRALLQLFGDLVGHARLRCSRYAMRRRAKSLNKSAISNQQFAISSSLSLILVGTFYVLRDRDGIVREPVLVDSVSMWIADLFVGRTIAFDRALVDVGIVLLYDRHRCHAGLLICRATLKGLPTAEIE